MKIMITNKKYQKNINKCLSWLKKHNSFNGERDLIEDSLEVDYPEDDKSWRAINRKCETSFDNYLTHLEELPKYIQKEIENSDLYKYG